MPSFVAQEINTGKLSIVVGHGDDTAQVGKGAWGIQMLGLCCPLVATLFRLHNSQCFYPAPPPPPQVCVEALLMVGGCVCV